MAPTSEPLAGRVALVTGAGGGIGRATAETLRAAGADVWTNVRVGGAAETGDAVADRLLAFDVSDPAMVRSGFTQLQKASGRLDILVNNAGVMHEAAFEMTTAEAIDEMLRVNLRGALLCAQFASRLMARAGGGAIVNIASIIGLAGNPGQVAYGASKAGLIGATLGMAKELARKNIRVNAVAPGVIDTKLLAATPKDKLEEIVGRVALGRIGRPEDVASVCLFLASDAAAYVTGQVIGVDGGLVI
jgi:3-oxoacyl-[acyl-carrier protein] reductase